MFVRKNNSSGSILVIVLVLIGIATVGLMTMLGVTNSVFNIGGAFRKGLTLKLKAEAGFQLAKTDLKECIQVEDFPANCLKNLPDSASQEEIIDRGIKAGLVYDDNRNCTEPANCEPRFTKQEGKIETSVFYIPKNDNGGDASKPPKSFEVISQAKNTMTGEVHTIEALLQVKSENFSEITFGMLKPALRKGITKLTIMPATYGGHVHFGNPVGDVHYFFDRYDTTASLDQNTHQFDGPVTFSEVPIPGEGRPFERHQDSEMNFEKGYTSDFDVQTDTDAIFNYTKDKATLVLNPSKSNYCLKLVPGNPKGEIRQYDCKMDEIKPLNRYDKERLGNIGTKIGEIDNTIIFCGDPNDPSETCNIHVKGIVQGALTVAAENIYIEGDIVYKDQSAESKDLFGALAKTNLVVPRGVPNGLDDYQAMDGDNPVNRRLENITNFNPGGKDRDEGDSDYPTLETGKVKGYKNTPGTLDLEGMFMAVGGVLDLEGFNDLSTNTKEGTTILNESGQPYAYTKKLTNSYFYESGGSWDRHGNPMFCSNSKKIPCPWDYEAMRAVSSNLWIYGGLLTKGYSYTKFEDSGFQRRVIKTDPRFSDTPPPGYPPSNSSLMVVLSVKSYGGKSTLLASTF